MAKTTQIILSDTHFGVRNNSINWLESQKDFIYNQFIPFLKKTSGNKTVIHLGDVFDSRSSISPMICKEANAMLEKISENCDRFIIIAGNHDYFSPIEGNDNSTSLEMLPCLWKSNNIDIQYQKSLIIDNNAFIPWFDFHNIDKLKSIISKYDINNIFTHTDLVHLDEETLNLTKGKNIFTGHIHIPMIRSSRGWFTLGSCYSINYQDANSQRGFYTLEDWNADTLKFYENIESLKFYRILNEECLNFEPKSSRDYVELTIETDMYEREDIQEAIKALNGKCNFSVIEMEKDIEIGDVMPDMGLYEIVRNKCPEKLHNKLDSIIS